MRQSNASHATARSKDAILVKAALDGDPRAATVIVERYAPLVRRCLGASFAGADLDDQLQEVLLRLFEQLPRLRNPEALRSYLIGIALRHAATERRRFQRRSWERLTPKGELPERASLQPPIEIQQVASRTRALLGRLQPQSSQVLELRFIQERELLDVARDMGVSRATAQRKLVHASARVRLLARGEPVLVEYVGAGPTMRGEAATARAAVERGTRRGVSS